MKLPVREFKEFDAARSSVPLWICCFGPSGCGKTYSSLELATGVQQVRGGDIAFIDTEGNRALAYADYFKFKHWPLTAPFGSLDYLAAIQAAYAKGRRIIIVDSFSHEHEGTGGLIDSQEDEVQRMVQKMGGNDPDWKKAERVKMLAWTKPKQARRALLNGMTALTDVTFILNFRAADVSKPVKAKDGGKTEVLHMGFTPIGARDFVYEATVSLFLPPASRGKYDMRPENVGEQMMTKIPRQFEELLAEPHQLSRRDGAALATWAQGSSAPAAARGATAEASNGNTAAAQEREARSKENITTLAARLSVFKQFLAASPSVALFEKRWNRAESVALRAELDEDTLDKLEVEKLDLRELVEKRERGEV